MSDIIFCCPNCRATLSTTEQREPHCGQCHSEFFKLAEVPCLFSAGKEQKRYWEHLLAAFIQQSQEQKQHHLKSLAKPSNTRLTIQRLEKQQHVREMRQQSVIKTLRQAGLTPRYQQELAGFSAQGFTQYYDLILRDWAWSQSNRIDQNWVDENAIAFKGCKSLIEQQSITPKKVLVLGAGAARLASDIHSLFTEAQTVAVDNNPLLALVASSLPNGKSLPSFYESTVSPQRGLPEIQERQLSSQYPEPTQLTGWQVIAADAWALPLQTEQFDLVITPWFIDVCGKDVKAIQGLVASYLKDGGYWLNYGPLLYLENTPVEQQYCAEEIRELMPLAGFTVAAELFIQQPYTHSPVSPRGRIEECWYFLAQKQTVAQQAFEKPLWLIGKTQPIPDIRGKGLIPEELKNIEDFIDGTRSIVDLENCFRGSLPEGLTAEGFVETLINDFLLNAE